MTEQPDSIFDDDWPADHRSGVIAVVGRPNVGKSTLINRILGQKIAIVTPKPQTTRTRQLGIYTVTGGQILFVDTPGLHKPHHKLGKFMVNMAETALKDADVILWVLDVSEEPRRPDQYIAETLARLRGETPIILALNKADLRDAVDEAATEQHLALVSHSKALLVSALEGDGVEELVQYLLSQLPVGPRYYPGDQVSEVNMRFIAAEIVREKIILNTEHEIPHSVAIEVDSYEERSDDLTYISAIIYVERNSQKGIIIGKKGGMIRTIGAAARKELTGMLDTRVYLDLRVKVLKNWRQDEKLMKRLGYALPKDDSR